MCAGFGAPEMHLRVVLQALVHGRLHPSKSPCASKAPIPHLLAGRLGTLKNHVGGGCTVWPPTRKRKTPAEAQAEREENTAAAKTVKRRATDRYEYVATAKSLEKPKGVKRVAGIQYGN
ncbi:hypothetical protein B0H14DRAFT_2621170 [Mycena olivaceomarginata]|nr:hypothetical protein B0H14DRAFT_2621170 [Mycena olivaceomarginata]